MTTSSDPDEIRAEIERTRAAVSDDVNRLTDTANPKNVAKRQVDKAKEAVMNVKDTVMGSASDALDASDATQAIGDKAGQAREALGDKADQARQAVGQAPGTVKAKTRGNPLAAGVIAFGAGLLISSLIPSSQKEQRAVSQLQENLEPLKEKATDAVKEVADNLRQPAQDAAASVKESAQAAVGTVKDEGSSAVGDVKGQVQDSKDTVQESRTS